ncbi:arylsulfatase [Robiginitalea sp. SC105]|uniref:arylsulfatase n=1 Tax=Robiginitalea sp. SC105 TaxID=2762332 RepID=UPI001639660F|nr:arylsulfatase [Robiginitalea sp. SC105]MBC2840287.1 arylsulfatase [Robiginitalea sp. SC105]
MLRKPLFLFCIPFLALLLPGCENHPSPATQTPPNILIVLTDDQGWGDLGIHGNTNIRTPFLDSLARSGTRFANFYVQPVCSPTRAELLTGRYASSLGVYSTSAGGERMDPDVPTLGSIFQNAGYRTGLFGKWHNGSQPPYHPNFRGFGEFYGFASGHWAHYFSPELERNGEFVRGHGYLADDLTDQVIAFTTQPDPRPFLAVLSLNTPHSPMQVPEPYWARLKQRPISLRHRDPEAEDTLFTRAALAMVENIDTNVGRVLSALREQNLQNNTLVVFLSDNGPNSYRWNGGMKGRKGSTDEGGVRSPLIVSWPGHIPEGQLLRSVGAGVDLLPTLAALAGVSLPTGVRLDGFDLSAGITGTGAENRPGLIFNHWNGKTSVRSQRFRLDAENQLYDIENDPGQQEDVSTRFPKMHDSLLRARNRWLLENVSETNTQRPFTLGYPGSGQTVLPARDATAGSPVRRSNRFPNASYMTGWDREAGGISWPVELLSEGTFEVTAYYACTEATAGTRLWMTTRTDSVGRTIETAFESEAYGMEQDRVPRIESYAKDFRPLPLGQIGLSPGRDTIRLHAGPFAPGANLEIQRLVFRRMD